jgi:hypothetical protein
MFGSCFATGRASIMKGMAPANPNILGPEGMALKLCRHFSKELIGPYEAAPLLLAPALLPLAPAKEILWWGVGTQ